MSSLAFFESSPGAGPSLPKSQAMESRRREAVRAAVARHRALHGRRDRVAELDDQPYPRGFLADSFAVRRLELHLRAVGLV